MGLSRSARIRTLLVIDTTFFFIELIVGYSTKSLALIADSFHMLNDVASLIVALYAIKLASDRSTSPKYTYGWQRAEILGALINGVFLLALCFSIFMEAIERFFNPTEVGNPKLVVIVGAFGLLSNIVGLFLFHDHGHSHGGHSHSHDHGGHSHSHAPSKSKKTPDIESGHAHQHASHAHQHGERQPLLAAPSSSSSNNSAGALPGYDSTSASAQARAEDEESEEERMDELLYAHPAQTRANLLRAAQEGLTTRNRDRKTSLSAVQGAGAAVGHEHQHGEEGHQHGEGDGHDHHAHDHAEGGAHGHEAAGGGGHSHGSMNMRGVFLHVLGDALGNVGVIVAGLIIWLAHFPSRFYADPIISLIITIIIFSSALPLVRSACSILLQGVPAQISLDRVRTSILSVRGVVSLHELHVWSLSESTFVASVHIVVEGGDYPRVAAEIREALHTCGIHSSTIQPEFVNERGELVITRPPSPNSKATGGGVGRAEEGEARREASTVTVVPNNERDCLVQCVEDSCRGSTCCPPAGTVNGEQ